MRRLGFWLRYAIFLLACVTAAAYLLFWRPFVAELRGAERSDLTPPRWVDQTTMLRLGSLLVDRTSAFARAERVKTAGVLRLCAFGDSFTYGDEVADGNDYPTQLRRVFAEHGAQNVEVLNFGSPWHGFHQTYALWDGVGRGFGCDVVLLGPSSFQPERDTTFNHTNLLFPYYLHARYVLDGGDVRVVEVAGRSVTERFESYFAFVPQWRYLRYDRSAPAFLKAIVGRHRTLRNPFYYDARSRTEEARATYAVLLGRMADAGVPIVLLHFKREIVDLANALGRANLVAARVPGPHRFPLLAPAGHLSRFGNRWIAEQFYAVLTGDVARPTSFTIAPVPPRQSARADHPLPVAAFDRIEATLGGESIGVIAVLQDLSEEVESSDWAARAGTTSLLALVPDGGVVADAAFVPVPGMLHGNEAVTLAIEKGGSVERIVLGAVLVPDARVSFGVAPLPGLGLPEQVELHGSASLAESRLRGASVTLSVGNVEILRSEGSRWPLVLRSVHGDARSLRTRERPAPTTPPPDDGVLALAFERAGATIEIPIAAWRREPREPIALPRRLPQRVTIADGRANLAGSDGAR